MPNVQQIYVKRGEIDRDCEDSRKALIQNIRPESRLKIKNFLIKRNENAARAYMQFPTDTDIDTILGKPNSNMNASNYHAKPNETSFSAHSNSLINDHFNEQNGNFNDYLSGKINILTPPALSGLNGHQAAQELMFSQQAVTCHMIE